MYPYHQYSLGVSWKQSKTCNHPLHISQKSKKAHPVHSFPIYLTKLTSKRYNIPFPVETFSEDENENIAPSALPNPDFVSDEVLIYNEQLEKSRDEGNINRDTGVQSCSV